jgi:hypothetical protein
MSFACWRTGRRLDFQDDPWTEYGIEDRRSGMELQYYAFRNEQVH